MKVLGIETSCDETGIAIYDTEKGLIADKLYSQVDLHAEIAEVDGTNLYIDIYLTGNTSSFGLSNSDWVFNFNPASFTTPTFTKVSNPAPVLGAIDNGYCTFTSVTHTNPTDPFGAVLNVQKPYFDNTATSIIGNTFVVNLGLIVPGNLPDYNNKIAIIDKVLWFF